MPNTKSAERRSRNSARKQLQNRSSQSRLKTIENNFHTVLKSGKPEDRTTAFRSVASALDKAAKSGVIPKATANRKKSRLAARINAVKA